MLVHFNHNACTPPHFSLKLQPLGFIIGFNNMLHTEEIEYQVGHTVYKGFMANDHGIKGPKPCVLIAPDWTGRSESFCQQARQLAKQGYVGFTVDMYGNAKLGQTLEEKTARLTSVMQDRSQVTQRMLKAFQTAAALPWVNPHKIAAIGYCFGGLCVLDLARSGADIKGAISFHGILSAPEQPVCKKVSAKILVLHGYEDPMVPPAQVQQFAKEMTEKKADWQIHMYGHTQHAFTNPEANNLALGLHYNQTAAHRSWQSAEQFLKEIF
jgi:dienelactone hydrolase